VRRFIAALIFFAPTLKKKYESGDESPHSKLNKRPDPIPWTGEERPPRVYRRERQAVISK